ERAAEDMTLDYKRHLPCRPFDAVLPRCVRRWFLAKNTSLCRGLSHSMRRLALLPGSIYSPTRYEINRKAAQPVSAFVVFAGHSSEPSAAVVSEGFFEGWDTYVGFGQPRSDALEHPGPAQVQPIDMRKFRIGLVGR